MLGVLSDLRIDLKFVVVKHDQALPLWQISCLKPECECDDPHPGLTNVQVTMGQLWEASLSSNLGDCFS